MRAKSISAKSRNVAKQMCSAMDSRNWRSSLTLESRREMHNRIVDTLQRHMPLSGQDGMAELLKIAARFEEEICFEATDEHDYLKKISSKILDLESRTQGASYSVSAESESSSEGVNAETEVQESVWTKMQALKQIYLTDVRTLCQLLAQRSQQNVTPEQHAKLESYKTLLERMIPYLVAENGMLPKDFKQDKVDAFEKQLVSIIEIFRRHSLPREAQQVSSPPVPVQPVPQVQSLVLQTQNLQLDN